MAREALSYNADNIPIFFKDLLSHGCSSGMIGFLIYYRDTHRFFDKYYDEIEELREEYEDGVGEPIQVKGDMITSYAWFAFEETARKIADELEIGW